MKTLVLSLFALVFAMPAAALAPETAAYLKSIGLNPDSEDVRMAEQAGEIETTFMDEPVTYSVESLARDKKKNGLIRFVATRAFITKLKRNFDSTRIPELYESIYLTTDERSLVGRKVAMSFLPGNKKPS